MARQRSSSGCPTVNFAPCAMPLTVAFRRAAASAHDDGDAEKPAVTFEAQPPRKIVRTRNPRAIMLVKPPFGELRQSPKPDTTANISQDTVGV
jgi:hypothetical protein